MSDCNADETTSKDNVGCAAAADPADDPASTAALESPLFNSMSRDLKQHNNNSSNTLNNNINLKDNQNTYLATEAMRSAAGPVLCGTVENVIVPSSVAPAIGLFVLFEPSKRERKLDAALI